MSKTKSKTKASTRTGVPMTPKAARRIQAHADRTGTNQKFKSAAQRAAAKNTNPEK